MRNYRTIALLAASVVAAPAEAATYIVTYSGTVTDTTDTAGIFGPVGSTLDGDTFQAVYTLTDPTPGAETYRGASEGNSFTYGGSAYGRPSPLSGTLTINGVTKIDSGNFVGEAAQTNDNPYSPIAYDEVSHYVGDAYGDRLFTDIYTELGDIVDTSNYTDALHYTVTSDDRSSGYFVFYDDAVQHATYGNLIPLTVDIALAPVAAVPEPATWLMIICGIGLTGSVLRRRKAMARLAVA